MAVLLNAATAGIPESPIGWNYTPIISNTTTVIKSGPGIFGGIYATNAGTTWTAQVFDNTVGSGQALTNNGTVLLGLQLNPSGQGVNTTIGITIVTAGTLAGALYVLWV